MTFFPEAQRQGNSHLSNFVLKIKATRLIPKYIFIMHIVSQSFQVFSSQVCGLKVFIMSKVQSRTHPTPKLFCYKFWAMSQANGSGYWVGLTGRPTGRPWVKKPTHSLSHWATGLPTGFNITGLGCPLAWWASGLLGQPMGHGLFDDPRSFWCRN